MGEGQPALAGGRPSVNASRRLHHHRHTSVKGQDADLASREDTQIHCSNSKERPLREERSEDSGSDWGSLPER